MGGINPVHTTVERGLLDMPVSKAQQKAVVKYVKSKYDRHMLTMPKGKKSILQVHASERNESLNGFVNRAIDETVERDKKGADG